MSGKMVMMRTFRNGKKEEENQASWSTVAKPIRLLSFPLRPVCSPYSKERTA